jgi:hypothetical protein
MLDWLIYLSVGAFIAGGIAFVWEHRPRRPDNLIELDPRRRRR